MAKWLVLHPDNPQPRLVAETVARLEQGAVMAYPTGHNYALACLYGEKKALDRLYRLRDLSAEHPMTLMCRDLSQITDYATLDNTTFKQIKPTLGRCFTYVLPINKRIARQIPWQSKNNEQGFQVAATPLLRHILAQLSAPLVTCSCVHASEAVAEAYLVDECIGNQIDLLLDTGEGGVEQSTVVKFDQGVVQIIRQGIEDATLFF